MLFLKLLFRTAQYCIFAAVSFLLTIGGIIGIFGAPQSVLDEFKTIGESPQASAFWGLVGPLIAIIWYLLTKHPLLVGIVWVGVALIWYLMVASPKEGLKEEYDRTRAAAREGSKRTDK